MGSRSGRLMCTGPGMGYRVCAMAVCRMVWSDNRVVGRSLLGAMVGRLKLPWVCGWKSLFWWMVCPSH